MNIIADTNLDEIQTKLEEIQGRGHDMAPLFEEIANHLYNLADEAFENEASPDGTAWRFLTYYTVADKQRDRILHETGHMRETLDFDSDGHSATVGTNAVSEKGYPYPAVHQFGTEDGKVPARPFLPFTDQGDVMDEATDSILALVREHFEY